MLPFLTLEDVLLQGENVLLRLDLNMTMKDGVVTDTSRLQASERTLKTLEKKGARTVILTHIGRPKNQDPTLSTFHIQSSIEALLKRKITFVSTIAAAKEALEKAQDGDFILLENLRFFKGEEKNDPEFCKALAALASSYVNDAFAVSHRKHASVYGVLPLMKTRIAGYQLLEEIKYLHLLTHTPKRPVLTIIGGSKISTKLSLLKNILTFSDTVFVGGAMATTFLVALGRMGPGVSLYEPSMIEEAKDLSKRNQDKLFLPLDAVVTDSFSHPHTILKVNVDDIPPHLHSVDIGPKTLQLIEEKMNHAATILWNGPLGVFETPPFDEGSKVLAKILVQCTKKGAITVAGGGETLACLGALKHELSFASTAGGAFLESLEGQDLPGIAALRTSFSPA